MIDTANRSAINRYLPLAAWMTFIWIASSNSFSASNTSTFLGPLLNWLFPNASMETLIFMHFVVRKVAHFLEYALLGFFAARAFSRSPQPKVRRRWFLISAALIITYAILDEYHQSFVPSRTASFSDSLVDMAGGITALLIIRRRLLKTVVSR